MVYLKENCLTKKLLSKVKPRILNKTKKNIKNIIKYEPEKYLTSEELYNLDCGNDYNDIIKKSDNNIKLAIQYLEMKYYDIPIETSWKIYLKKLIKIFNKCLTKQITQQNIEEIREILYKIFITNINGTRIIKELLNFILLNFKNNDLNYDIINLCTNYEN